MTRRRRGSVRAVVASAALALPWLLLAVAHAGALAGERAVAAILLVGEDLLVAGLLVSRRRARYLPWTARNVVAAFGALVLPLALSAPSGLRGDLAPGLEVAGIALALVATATLGRDMGILPALRGVTTRGVYRVMRHPMYAAHLLIGAAYVLGAPSWRNVAIVAIVGTLLVVRLRAEESLLDRDPRYRAYCRRVPWRLVPGCY